MARALVGFPVARSHRPLVLEYQLLARVPSFGVFLLTN